jgi:hypothetical protein
VALFLDFDGTLVPLQDSPDQVLLPVSLRRMLLALSNQENRIVAVVSGRQRSDLQARVNVPGLVYAGNHGLEISGPGFVFIEPSAIGYRDKLLEFAKDLATRIKGIPDAWVEDKGLTLSVHSRLVAPEQGNALKNGVIWFRPASVGAFGCSRLHFISRRDSLSELRYAGQYQGAGVLTGFGLLRRGAPGRKKAGPWHINLLPPCNVARQTQQLL